MNNSNKALFLPSAPRVDHLGLHYHHPHAKPGYSMLFRIRSFASSMSYARDWLGRLPGPLMHDRHRIHISPSTVSVQTYRLACIIDTKQAKCCHSCNGQYKYHADSLASFQIRSQRLPHSGRCYRTYVSHICKHEDT